MASIQSPVTQRQLLEIETDVAVLYERHKNLDGKVDELKLDLKEVRDSITATSESTQSMLQNFQKDNIKSHKEMTSKITALEKWRWMLMGAGLVIGALGWPVIEKLLGM
jgi:predicted  nucleic acid-binding Zn-ribbon protein